MRLLSLALVLSSLAAVVPAQQPADASAKVKAATPAAEKLKVLSAQHAERMKALPKGDDEARATAMTARITDLEGFVKDFAATPEANKANLEIAMLAMRSKDHAEKAHAALAAFDAGKADLRSTIQAASIANLMKLEDRKTALVDAATAKATTIEDRLELVSALRSALKDNERADKVYADTEAMAKSDEDKATLLMSKATTVKRTDPKNADAYKAELEALVKAYPATKAGRIAAGKIAAAGMKAGTDPVPFTVKDLDGKDVSPASYKGKVLLIDFWATWCGPCMKELPNVIETYKAYHDQGFEILGISLDREGDRQKLDDCIKENGMTWRHVYDGKWWSAEVAQMYDVSGIPFTVLIGRDGKVIDTSLRGDKLGAAVKQAIEAK